MNGRIVGAASSSLLPHGSQAVDERGGLEDGVAELVEAQLCFRGLGTSVQGCDLLVASDSRFVQIG